MRLDTYGDALHRVLPSSYAKALVRQCLLPHRLACLCILNVLFRVVRCKWLLLDCFRVVCVKHDLPCWPGQQVCEHQSVPGPSPAALSSFSLSSRWGAEVGPTGDSARGRLRIPANLSHGLVWLLAPQHCFLSVMVIFCLCS